MRNFSKILIAIFVIGIIAYSLWGDATIAWHKIQNFDFADSDDTVRILEVRNWLNGQGFFDLFLHRANPPYGASMHWSRISDAPLALMQLVLRPFVGIDSAEKMAVFALPLILSAIFLLIVSGTAKRINGSNYSYFFAAILFLYSVSASYNFVAGRVDHHALQIIALVCMVAGFMRADKIGGIISGISLGLSLAIGFEILPIQVILVAWLAIVWALQPNRYSVIAVSFSVSLFFAIAFGFFVNVAPENYFKGANDALSIAQFAPIAMGAILLAITAKMAKNLKTPLRFATLFMIAIAVLGTAWQFPDLRKPLYWQIDPVLYELWLSKNGEVVPMIERPYLDQLSVGGVLGIGILATIIRLLTLKTTEKRGDFDTSYNWSLLLIALSAATAMTFFFQTRVHSHATALALLVFASALPMAFSNGAMNLFLASLLIFLPLTKGSFKKAAQDNIGLAGGEYDYNSDKRCQAIGDFAHLAAMPKGLVAANISLGAQTLIATNHDVLTTAYHRDWGRDYLFDIYNTNSNEALAKIKKRGINYFAFCIRDIELENMVKYRPNGFLADVLEGRVPNYLEKIDAPYGSGIRVFRVVEQAK